VMITDTLSWWAPFEALEVGQEFTTRGRTVTEADVVGFAQLTGDWHPQHADAQWAESSPFGERIAHGMLVLSYAVGLMPFEPDRVVALRRVADTAFKRPVRIGDTIHVEGEVVDKTELDPGHGLVTCRWRILKGVGTLVARASVEVVWRRERTQPAPAVEEAEHREPVLL
jgi:3-hydroxybutyryl-CoA dehydratase